MSKLYKSNVFIESADAVSIIAAGKHFLQGYARLAVLSFQDRQPRFPLLPKIHMLYHVVYLMAVQSTRAPVIENPMTQNCSMDEDFIGRFCVLTRSVSPRCRILRAYQRYFSQVLLLWLRRQREWWKERGKRWEIWVALHGTVWWKHMMKNASKSRKIHYPKNIRSGASFSVRGRQSMWNLWILEEFGFTLRIEEDQVYQVYISHDMLSSFWPFI